MLRIRSERIFVAGRPLASQLETLDMVELSQAPSVFGGAGLQLGSSRRAPFQQSIAKDKLHSTLALCVQCGFLNRERDGGYRVAPAGRERMRGLSGLHRGSPAFARVGSYRAARSTSTVRFRPMP